jgi:hypothetical protein
MTLTVRLPDPLEEALEQYSAAHGLTKSHVVQEALAEYLVRAQKETPARKGEVSENYRAFKKAGVIGCVSGMRGTSATKEVVRQRALERLTRPR